MRKNSKDWRNMIVSTMGIIALVGITFFLTLYFVWQLTNTLGV